MSNHVVHRESRPAHELVDLLANETDRHNCTAGFQFHNDILKKGRNNVASLRRVRSYRREHLCLQLSYFKFDIQKASLLVTLQHGLAFGELGQVIAPSTRDTHTSYFGVMRDQCAATSAQANIKLESVTAVLECEIE